MPKSAFLCPNCGEEVPDGARACPACGSDENTGWSESTYLDGIDLPLEEDEYEEIKANEFGNGNNGNKRVGLFSDINWKMVIAVTAILTLISSIVIRGC